MAQRFRVLVLTAVCAVCGPVSAQERSDDRITPPGGQVSTVGSGRVQRGTQITPAGEGTRAQPQVSRRTTSTVASGQVTGERASSGGSPQVAKRDPSTQGSTPLSTRSEGRQTAVAPLVGADRCDPEHARAASAVRCDRVIETRSAEFVRPAPPVLSPEQRLMLDQERVEMRGVRGAAQRAARNDIDANSAETQALAAITLGQGAPETTVNPTGAEQPTSEAVDAIVQIITGLPSVTPR